MKNSITQFSLVIIAFVALSLLMSSRPAADEPKQYMVVLEQKTDNFEKQVNQKLSEGWHLQGGVNVYGQNHYQAMVK